MDKIKGHGFEQSISLVGTVQLANNELFNEFNKLSQDELAAFLRQSPFVDSVLFANDEKITDVSTQK